MTDPRPLPEIDHVVMGLYLEYRRHQAGLTIYHLAQVSGVADEHVRACCDTRPIPPEAIFGLCAWMCRDPEFFSKAVIDELRRQSRDAMRGAP